MENNTDGASDENDEKMKNLDISEKEDNKDIPVGLKSFS